MGGCLRYIDLDVESKDNLLSYLDGLCTNHFLSVVRKSLASATRPKVLFLFPQVSLLVHCSVLDVFFHTRKLGHGT